MGFHNVVVVKRTEPDMEEIRRMATHLSSSVVDKIRFCDDLKKALSGFHYIVGTTSRTGKARQVQADPRTMAGELIDISHNSKIAVLFGPEDFGLSNDELWMCHSLVEIPTAGELKSLNLSQAVMIVCYELFMAHSEKPQKFTPKLARASEVEGMYDQLRELFLKINFIQQQNPEYWMLNVRRFLSRVKLYSREVRLIRGVCRQLDWYMRTKGLDIPHGNRLVQGGPPDTDGIGTECRAKKNGEGKMSEIFEFTGARRIIFGTGSLSRLAGLVKECHAKKPFIVMDGHLSKAGCRGQGGIASRSRRYQI